MKFEYIDETQQRLKIKKISFSGLPFILGKKNPGMEPARGMILHSIDFERTVHKYGSL